MLFLAPAIYKSIIFSFILSHSSVVEKILLRRPDVVNIPKEDGFTALHLAAVNGHYKIAQTLLTKGRCNLELRNNKQETPLIEQQLEDRKLAPICYLANRGADLYKKNNNGVSPLDTANAIGIAEVVVAWATKP
ncbi:hypothetical protein HPB48_015985 [Haemaphysalis longicornis]|uniref:Uncharacterized protein n=1 Tax=Haemaphysalis longicornis TaxID=44386 RepID=A0A9J6GBU8_HAELO|nr:hypothetical protein HPB48_015985 [Haemaphysalis longicornis]